MVFRIEGIVCRRLQVMRSFGCGFSNRGDSVQKVATNGR